MTEMNWKIVENKPNPNWCEDNNKEHDLNGYLSCDICNYKSDNEAFMIFVEENGGSISYMSRTHNLQYIDGELEHSDSIDDDVDYSVYECYKCDIRRRDKDAFLKHMRKEFEKEMRK